MDGITLVPRADTERELWAPFWRVPSNPIPPSRSLEGIVGLGIPACLLADKSNANSQVSD
jgi:hypothetical protein